MEQTTKEIRQMTVALANCVSNWMTNYDLKKEISALTLLWLKLEGEDRKTLFNAMGLLASINVTIDALKSEGGESIPNDK